MKMKLFLALLSIVILSACSAPKDVVYFQGEIGRASCRERVLRLV